MLKGAEIEALSKSGKDMAADPRAHTVSKCKSDVQIHSEWLIVCLGIMKYN
jgi:hypothetical protein